MINEKRIEYLKSEIKDLKETIKDIEQEIKNTREGKPIHKDYGLCPCCEKNIAVITKERNDIIHIFCDKCGPLAVRK